MLHKSKLFEKEIFGSHIKTLNIFGESAFHKLRTIVEVNGVQKAITL